ncbi:hypothetical protein F4823DRAFT_295672 [Ustulina deusta]|nr:hypothetical protein F4823DRAFT_295672 [Ustulina deusta]
MRVSCRTCRRRARPRRYESHSFAFTHPFRNHLTKATEKDSGEKEITSSWALFISIVLLIIAFFTSYTLQQKKVQAVHETVISIFAGR